VHVTKDGGSSWKNVSDAFPKDLWVSRVVASSHAKERVYVALNGYRWDDFNTYLYVSEDYGETWESIASNIPDSPVNVIKEDPENENILYTGTDNGLYVSFNRGNSWQIFGKDVPNVAVHDLVIQEREKDLVVGTHGRSIYVADIELVQELTIDNMNNILVSDVEPIRASRRWGSKGFNQFGEYNEPELNIQFYAPETAEVKIAISNTDGKVLKEWKNKVDQGISIEHYNLSVSEKGKKILDKEDISIEKSDNGTYYLPKGKYKIRISQGNQTSETDLEIK
jgi:hypothetical protein